MEKALRGSEAQLQRRGFEFVWAESAYRVCVYYKGEHVGTFDAHHRPAYSIPREAREAMYVIDQLNSARSGR